MIRMPYAPLLGKCNNVVTIRSVDLGVVVSGFGKVGLF